MKKSVKCNFTDEQLVKNYLNGDTACLGILYERHFNNVYYKCLSFSKKREETFDLVQEIFLKTFNKLHLFKGNAEFSTWLYRITQNFCIEYYRKNNKYTYEDLSKCNYLFEEEYEPNKFEYLSLETVINSISETEQLMLKQKYIEGKSVKELQDQFNLGASAVKMRLQRAKQKIGKQIKLSTEYM
jgi:RNA polymerase sigma-70 factor (ECF subfamily)